MGDIIAALPIRSDSLEKKQLRHNRDRVEGVSQLSPVNWDHLNSVLQRTSQPDRWESGEAERVVQSHIHLISLPNLHPLWPDHTSLNADSFAGSLIFSLTHTTTQS